MKKITDENLLNQLENNTTKDIQTKTQKKVTEPEILDALNNQSGRVSSFAKGFTKNFDEYASSINKGLDYVADKITGRDTKFFEDNTDYWNKQSKLNDIQTSSHPNYRTGGTFILDPANITPAGIVSKGQKLGKLGYALTKTKPRAIATSMAGGAGVGYGTTSFKNYGNDSLSQQDKDNKALWGAGIVAGLNGIISALTKGRVNNAIKDLPSDVNPNNGDEVAKHILNNADSLGLNPQETQAITAEVLKGKYPKVPNEFKIEQAGFGAKQTEPNFQLRPQNPPAVTMDRETALAILAKEANRKRAEQGLKPIYPELPKDRIEKIKETAEKNGYLFANGMHSMAGGFAGGADSLINQRDYNQDGKYDYKDLLAGVIAGTVSINALKKLAPKLFEEKASNGSVKAGLFAGERAKGFDAKKNAGKTFYGKYDTMDRFEIDDSKAILKGTPKELNAKKNEIHWQDLTAIREQYDSGALQKDEAMKLFENTRNKMSDGRNGTHLLSDVLDHKELFDNYPTLEDTKVTFTDMPKGASGYYDAKANEITLNSNMSNDEIKSSILHELQHAIQKKEGFARGGSAQEFYNDFKRKKELLEYELEFEPDDFIRDKKLAELKNIEKELENGAKEKAFDMYQRLAGEIEARDVQARMDYTPEQREKIKPYSSENIDRDDAIMKYHSNDDFLNMSESKKEFESKIKKAKSYTHIQKIVSDEAKREWGDATSTLKRWFTDTLGADYHKIREDATSSTNGYSVKMERLHNVLKELSKDDRTAMNEYITGDRDNISEQLKPLADNIKKSIDDLSKELVEKGVLEKDAYDEWAGHYIHRNYEKHFFKDVKKLMKKGFKIDEIKKRGNVQIISEREAKKLLTDVSFIAKTQKPLRDGGERLKKLPNGKYELRRDWTKEEREAMGEITDVSISAPETLMRLKRMADNADFLNKVKDIDEVVLKDVEKYTDEELKESGFVKVPNSTKFGVLAGKHIRRDVYDDISARNDELFNTFNGSDGAVARIWKNYLSLWKKSKTVWNAPSHLNNFISNQYLMHLSGMKSHEIIRAIGRAGKMMYEGNKYEELLKKKMLGKATQKDLKELADMGEDLKYFIEAKEGGLLGRSQLNDILAGQQKLTRNSALGKLDKFSEDMYHGEDAIGKIAMYAHLRDKVGMSADEARKAVLTIIPDYSKPMPKAYRALRDTGISPFISWSYYTMPAIWKLLKTKQGAKQASIAIGTLSLLEYMLTGGAVTPIDNLPFVNGNKPSDFKGRRFGISAHGDNITTIKTDRWIPYVELLNPVNFLISNLSGVTTNAVVNMATAPSKAGMINPYYGRPITYKNKSTGQKAYDYAKYLTQSYVPMPAQLYSGWNTIESLARSERNRRKNKVIKPRTTGQELLKNLGLNSMTYSKSEARKENNN